MEAYEEDSIPEMNMEKQIGKKSGRNQICCIVRSGCSVTYLLFWRRG
nr:hypothetical protein [Anoxybacillus caldiproteolyticus]